MPFVPDGKLHRDLSIPSRPKYEVMNIMRSADRLTVDAAMPINEGLSAVHGTRSNSRIAHSAMRGATGA